MPDDQRHDIEFRTDCPGDSQSQGYDYGWTGAVGPRRLRIAEECRDPSANSCLRVHVPAQRQVVDAFMAAARASEFEALLAVLDPDIVLRSDGRTARPEASMVLRGAAAVAGQAIIG